ncbi:MAG: right-handed parallel beta-helix repeat-containing protein, partial [Gemmatimonadota bacterium]
RATARGLLAASTVLATTTCRFADVLEAPGVQPAVLTFASDSVLVVAAPILPSVVVTVGGAPLPGARVAFATGATRIVAVHGDTLVPRKRGTTPLTVTLAGSLLPRNAPSLGVTLAVVADSVALDSSSVRLTSFGDTVTLVATVLDAAGETITGATPRWSSSDTTVATVSAAGRLFARGTGTAGVRAVVDRDTAVALVTVAQTLTRFTFEPASLRIDALAAAGSVVATGRDARGFAISGLAPTSWTIGDATVAAVSGPGQVTSLLNGSTYLYATRGAVVDSVAVTVAQRAAIVQVTPRPVPPVTSLGTQVQLTARAFDRRTVEIQTATPAWFTLDPGRVRVGTDGLVTALQTGTARVIATLDGAVDTAVVVISDDPASVVVTPDSGLATSLGDTLVFAATVLNGRGDSIAGAVVTWRTPDSTIVRVLPGGRAIAQQLGSARIIASVGGKADTATARVTNVAATLDILPGGRNLTSLGDADTPSVDIRNARGATLHRGAVSWTADDADIVRVSPIGQVTARDTGQTFVRASSGSLEDSVLYTVTNAPAAVRILGVFRDTVTMTALGQSFTFSVAVMNARNVGIANYPVSWRSTDRSVVDTVTEEGTATAVGTGTTLLVARAGGIEDSVVVVVQNPTRLYVNNGVVVSPRYGTADRPFARIQDAVAASDANDTIVIGRGSAPYAETIALTRRLTLLGDSGAFVGTRNPAVLPLIAHDTGTVGITVYTTAPMTLKYLALRHTLDGPAISADGSDIVVEWFYVNRTGSVSSRIGRGILVANSTSGTRIANTVVDSVRGYGIKLSGVSDATLQTNTIRGVDSLSGGAQAGAGIEVTGGSGNMLAGNTIRATQGAQVLVLASNQVTLNSNAFAGRHQLVRVVGVTGNGAFGNTFDLNPRIQDGDDHRGSQDDGRAGLTIDTSSSFRSFDNTFTETPLASATMDAIHINDSRAMQVYRNVFSGGFRNIVSQRSSFAVSETRSDSARLFLVASDADTITMNADTVRNPPGTLNNMGTGLGCVTVSGASSWLTVQRSQFENCHLGGGPAISMSSTDGRLELQTSTFLGAHQTAFAFDGRSALVRGNVASGLGTDPLPRNNVVGMSVSADTIEFVGNAVVGYRRGAGLALEGSDRMRMDSGYVTLNGVGMRLGQSATLIVQRSDVFDNDSVGVWTYGDSWSANVLGLWWGDARGPRRDADPTATGDSAVSNVVFAPVRNAPVFTGTTPASLRVVRGNGQVASANSTLPTRLTVRVIDASGRPVSGVSVTFTVTAGGGNFGGSPSTAVTTNSDGLAEVVLAIGSAAGANTVQATATSVSIGAVTFTATGT